MSDAPIEVTGAAGIVRTLVPDDATIEVRLGDAVRVPLHIVEPIHPAVAAVRWHFAFAESVFDGPVSALTPAHEPVVDAVFESIGIGTGAIVVQSAEFRLEDDNEWYPATVTQGAVRIVRVLPPVVDTVAGDLEKVE